MDLTGRVALVTGGSRGIGRAIAQRLAAHGVAVVVTASPRSVAGLEETCALIEAEGGKAAFVECDLADGTARESLIEDATVPFGGIDILVNNAAAIPAYAPLSRIELAARRLMFEVNFHAPTDLIQQALLRMHTQHWGRIINISSEMARQPPIPYPGPAKFIHALAAYGASKAALERATLGLAAELHGSGVTVNALSPFKIALTEGARAVAQQMAAQHPDWIEPVELMAEAAYLLVAGSLTGEITHSRALLQRLQAPLHALDGRTLMGDALTLARID